jgi:hypothetical protein
LIFWNDGIGRIWSHRYFTPYPCNFCDDVFAECADAVFLDAWLPPYVRDPAGHSIVLTRNPQLDGFLEQELRAPREVTVSRISLDDIVHSQQRVIQTKRGDLARRLAWAEELGMPVPPKRVRLLQGHRTFGRDLLIRACWKISQQSTAIWRRVDKNRQAFDEQMSVLRREADQARDHLIRYRRLNRLVHWLRSHLR